MNIEPELIITLAFSSVKSAHEFKILKYVDAHNLRLEGMISFAQVGYYLFRYNIKGEPKNLASFLNDKNILERTI